MEVFQFLRGTKYKNRKFIFSTVKSVKKKNRRFYDVVFGTTKKHAFIYLYLL